ncbi:MAG: hypothetical protein J6J24_02995 [Clostridia bacterium]|nr:hypothetical protein [Clostridia bacterium]
MLKKFLKSVDKSRNACYNAYAVIYGMKRKVTFAIQAANRKFAWTRVLVKDARATKMTFF